MKNKRKISLKKKLKTKTFVTTQVCSVLSNGRISNGKCSKFKDYGKIDDHYLSSQNCVTRLIYLFYIKKKTKKKSK